MSVTIAPSYDLYNKVRLGLELDTSGKPGAIVTFCM